MNAVVEFLRPILSFLTSPIAVNVGVFTFGIAAGLMIDWRFFRRPGEVLQPSPLAVDDAVDWEPTEQEIREDCAARGKPLAEPHLAQSRDSLIAAHHFPERVAQINQAATIQSEPEKDNRALDRFLSGGSLADRLEEHEKDTKAEREVARQRMIREARTGEGEKLPRLAPAEPKKKADKEYPYPYAKALLKLAIGRPSGTIQSPSRLTIAAQLKNDHTELLQSCSVIIRKVDGLDDPSLIGRKFKMSSGGHVQTRSTIVSQITLLRRDMSDTVTPEPFLLTLEGSAVPLKENSTYVLQLELRTKFPHPTISTVQIDTATGLEATARLVEQHVLEEDDA